MSRSDQIAGWLDRIGAAQQAASSGRALRKSGLLDDEPRARAGRNDVEGARPSSQRGLRDTTITGAADEESRRSLPMSKGGGTAGRGASARTRAPSSIDGGSVGGGAGQGGALSRARKLAAGYQPAVIKVVSYARGVVRATATGQYIQREEVALETHDGRMLEDRAAVAEEMKAWSTGFARRAESQDVTAVRLKLHGVSDTPEGRATYAKAIAAGFEGHRHAARIDATPAGALEARIVVAMAGVSKERFRIRDERIGEGDTAFSRLRFERASEAIIAGRIASATGQGTQAIDLQPSGTSHGRDGVTYRLNKLIERGAVTDDRGTVLANAAETRLVARDWGRSLRSQSSRDTMHLIISAKAGTDVTALTNAARSFLHDRFADHKFMFGVHTDKEADGHIHAHAVITVKNEAGQKMHPSRDTFRLWREAYAEHAQAEGLKIVASSARERASSQSYGPRDKAIVDAAQRPRLAREARDRAYASDPGNHTLIDKARQRISTARSNPIWLPMSAPARQAVSESASAWRAVAQEQPGNQIARDVLGRLTMAETVGAILHTIGKRVDKLEEGRDGMAITSEKMVQDLRLMNEAVSRTSDLLEGQTRKQFQEASARYLETLANRVDLQRLQESGVETMTRSEIEAIAGPNADRLIAHARQTQVRDAREAVEAEKAAGQAVEAERRDEARAGVAVESGRELRADRAMVAASETSAAREAKEAGTAAEVSRRLNEQPGLPLQQNLDQNDELAKLRSEQERVIEEIEAETESEALRPQRMS